MLLGAVSQCHAISEKGEGKRGRSIKPVMSAYLCLESLRCCGQMIPSRHATLLSSLGPSWSSFYL